uniref:Methionyl-tRNA synthetase anticodon-binding domain-containing protein n=1 Tax=Hucho hucho TaxID=62062 RepID=A0A4W5RXW3_9TELE
MNFFTFFLSLTPLPRPSLPLSELVFVSKFFENCVPAMELQQEDKRLLSQVGWELKQYINLMDKVKTRDTLKCILNISRQGNQYIQVNEPWKKIKGDDTDRQRAGTVAGVSVNVPCLLSVSSSTPHPPSPPPCCRDPGTSSALCPPGITLAWGRRCGR